MFIEGFVEINVKCFTYVDNMRLSQYNSVAFMWFSKNVWPTLMVANLKKS